MRWTAAWLSIWLAGCAVQPYVPAEVTGASFLERSISQTEGTVRVTVAVPDATETRAVFGLPLYDQGIQPIWIEIHNSGDFPVRMATWSIDPEYFSPAEVAWKNRKGFSKDGQARMERWFYDTAMRRRVAPGETRSGFVYTHLMPGTKGFNLDVFGSTGSQSFTFFVPMPGFSPDYMLVDFQNLYPPQAVTTVPKGDLTTIRAAMETLPCCSTDATGAESGGPFNVLLIGSGTAVRRMLLRGAWHETEADSPQTAVARTQRYQGRAPDGIFFKLRDDGKERRELRLWLSPYRLGTESVWLGQIGVDLSATTADPNDYVSDPNVDAARNFLFQEAWYSQSLQKAGFIDGVPPATRDAPAETFTGGTFFSDGLRAVLFLSEEPVAVGDAAIVPWRQLLR